MIADLALTTLGFTELESRLYCELLREAPVTGYRLAQICGKQPANVYQALKSLVQKGAIVANDGPDVVTTYVPIPPAELMNSLQAGFAHRRDEALTLLEGLFVPPSREQVYQLNTVSQVMERAHSMIAGAKESVLFDLFPGVYEMFEADLKMARNNGVTVAGLVYDEADRAPNTVLISNEVNPTGQWPGLVMILIVDAAQELIAHISRDRLRLLNGVWSDSAFLSSVYHSALASEIRLMNMEESTDQLKHLSLMRLMPPGMRGLMTPK